MMRLMKAHGQSTLELVILFAVVIAAWLAMQIYVKRAYEGRLKSAGDQIGAQFDPRALTGGTLTTTSEGSQTSNTNVDGKTDVTGIIETSKREVTGESIAAFDEATTLFEAQTQTP